MSVRLRARNLSIWSAAVFGIAFGVNFLWEMAQAFLYEPMGSAWEATRRCFVASVGDAALVLAILTSIRVWTDRAFTERQYALAATLAVVVAIAVERWGLAQGRWTYLPEMPRVPGTVIGVVPLVQMAILTPVTVWLANRTTGQT